MLGVELASSNSTYDWRRDTDKPKNFITLFPGCNAEDLSPLTICYRLIKLFRAKSVNVVFVPSYWPASSFAILLAAKCIGARCVMMNESHAATAKAQGLKHWIKKNLVQSFDAGLVGGTPQLRYFTSLGLPARKLFDGYDTVDNAYFQSRTELIRADSLQTRDAYGLPPRYFLNVGRMVPKKNLELLIDAYSFFKKLVADKTNILPSSSPLANPIPPPSPLPFKLATVSSDPSSTFRIVPALVLVGSGSSENTLRQRCLALGLTIADCSLPLPSIPDQENSTPAVDVYFYGFRQLDELPTFYALADVFVLPSKEEEWGLVVNEAMASSCAVLVSSAAGCCEDLVSEGRNGWSFDPYSPEKLAALLLQLADDPVLARRMGDESQRRIAPWSNERFAINFYRAAHAALST